MIKNYLLSVRKIFYDLIPERKESFNYTMHYFRAFAILCIVVGHCLGQHHYFAGYESALSIKLIDGVCLAFFSSATHYFAFISGFLFYVINRNTTVKDLYKKKIKNLLSPYIVLSICFIGISYCSYFISGNYLAYVWTPKSFTTFVQALVDGLAQGQFWYMPCILGIFFVIPWIMKFSEKQSVAVLVVLASFPFIFPRRGFDFFTFQGTVNYFCMCSHYGGMFCVGILCGIYRDKLLNFVSRFRYEFLFVGILTFFAVALNGKLHWIEGYYQIHYVQKLCFSAVIIFLFSKIKNSFTLDLIAQYSFPIYFLHLFIANLISNIFLEIDLLLKIDAFTRIILLTLTVIITSLFLSIFLKKIFGKMSRYVIGA